MPYLYVIEPPGGQPSLPNAFYWSLRLPLLAGMAALAWSFARRPTGRWTAALALMAAVGLLPACIFTGPPTPRFIYTALPFVCLIWARGLTEWRGGPRRALSVAAAVVWIGFVIGFYASPTLQLYRVSAARLGRFTAEVERLAPDWPRGAEIAIFDHPVPRGDWQWVYAQLVFDVFIPEAGARLVLDYTTSRTQRAYRFTDEGLVEMPRNPMNI
jgi:peptidoglycan/LPS O-acetylase OafA/YrhL